MVRSREQKGYKRVMKFLKNERKQRDEHGLGRKHRDFFISHHGAVMNYEQFA